MNSTAAIVMIFLVNALATIFLILFKPSVSLEFNGKRRTYATFYMPGVIAAATILITRLISFDEAKAILVGDGQFSPLGILILFLSMVFISIFLDSCGFFEYCARLAVRRSKGSGKLLFFIIYIVVSLLTIITSNDIIILTFTPFVYYFTKALGVDPFPFLLAEFFAANTWSMMLFVGNPTNIVVTGAIGIGFMEYFRWMLLPTIAAGIANALVLFLIFKKDISFVAKEPPKEEISLRDRIGAFMGLFVLATCIFFLSISPFYRFPLWLVAFLSAALLLAFIIIRMAYNYIEAKVKGTKCCHPHLLAAAKNMPWSVIPFVLSLFIIVGSLQAHGIPGLVGSFLSEMANGHEFLYVMVFGLASLLMANVMNNIPMTVAFVYILDSLPQAVILPSALATVIGSNLGANLTPIGALAGILWMTILKSYGFKVSFGRFAKYGIIVTFFASLASLLVLGLEFLLLG